MTPFVQNVSPGAYVERLGNVLFSEEIAMCSLDGLQLHVNYLKEMNKFGGSKNRAFIQSLVEFLVNCIILNTSNEVQQLALFTFQKLITQGAL